MDQSKINEQAAETVEKLVRAARWRSWTLGVLFVVVVVLCVVVFKGHLLVQDVQHGAFQSCVSGNSARAANRTIWDHVLGAFLQGKNVTPALRTWVANTESYIGLHEKVQDCAQLYPTTPWWHFWW